MKTQEPGEILTESFFLHQVIQEVTRATFKKKQTNATEYDFINSLLAVMSGIYHLPKLLVETREMMADHFGHLTGYLL
jgi:hypothetical protein